MIAAAEASVETRTEVYLLWTNRFDINSQDNDFNHDPWSWDSLHEGLSCQLQTA